MLAADSPWQAHAMQRIVTGRPEPRTPPERVDWSTGGGAGPGTEVLGRDLLGNRVLELGCGAGHHVAHLALHHGARSVGVDLVDLQIRRARAHYGHVDGASFAVVDALRHLQTPGETYDAIYSVFGAIGLVPPEPLFRAAASRLCPGGVLAFSVPHPERAGRRPSPDDRPREDYVTLPDRTRIPVERWEFDAQCWGVHLSRAGLRITSATGLGPAHPGPWPTSLLITARRR
ncbi:class I SAM-dependent methyltransferase [Streptomyces sp. NPDC001941]|uniref:class I SAM-dependent methyltransferase n=1 Tax=Streptomyces sp. NPDC001941 TaxID=3154659 RepID=UPI003328F782